MMSLCVSLCVFVCPPLPLAGASKMPSDHLKDEEMYEDVTNEDDDDDVNSNNEKTTMTITMITTIKWMTKLVDLNCNNK